MKESTTSAAVVPVAIAEEAWHGGAYERDPLRAEGQGFASDAEEA